MRTGLYEYLDEEWKVVSGEPEPAPDLVLGFVSPAFAAARQALIELRETFPSAHIVACTTGGEIIGGRALSGSFVAASLTFRAGHVHTIMRPISSRRDSFAAGREMAESLRAPNLKGVLVLADGLDTNGTRLVRGLRENLDAGIVVFGGLAGDDLDFIVTRVACNSELATGQIAAIGFYGSDLSVTHISASGWLPRPQQHQVTHHAGSILYEVDGRPALAWLRQEAGLPLGAGLPELMSNPIWFGEEGRPESGVIRTVIGLDGARGSLTLAGDVPGNVSCRLMHGRGETIVDGAATAARTLATPAAPSLALMVSCAGRRLILGEDAGREPAAVSDVLGGIPLIGYHSYGEIGRLGGEAVCDFHNQTMALTVVSEPE